MIGIEVEAKTELESWAREALEEQTEEARAEPGPQVEREPEASPGEGKLTPDEAGMLQRMEILRPGDFKGVAMLLQEFPHIREEILARAQQVCGNETVAKALELLEQQAAAPEPEQAPAQAEAKTEEPAPEQAVEQAVVASQPEAPIAEEEFVYILSPLALRSTPEQEIQEHVDFIRAHPHLRDQVLIGATEASAEFGQAVRDALEQAAPPEAAPVEAAPAAEQAPSPEAQAASEEKADDFVYLTSWLALSGGSREQEIQDHVDFIRNNPALRDAVLAGAAAASAEFGRQLQEALEAGTPAAPLTENEPTPPEVVEQAAADAAPTPDLTATPAEEVKEPEPQPEPGWVTRARAYHRNHPDQAAEFIQATEGKCLGPDGELDPNLVANWQVAAGVAPDGRVGPDTLHALILNQPAGYAELVELAEKNGEPPPDVMDPRFAN